MSDVVSTNAHRRIAIVAGSGLDTIADGFETSEVVSFEAIGLGTPTVRGHRGEVRFCETHGTTIAFVLGRRHFYEGAHDRMDLLVEWLASREVTALVSISAAGSLRRDAPIGSLVVVTDVIDLQNRERLVGARIVCDPAQATVPRPAPSARLRVDPELAGAIEAAATRAGVATSRGVLACGSGPAYETHGEVRWLQEVGADLVTMSAAPELAAANRHDLRIALIAVLTNPATGISQAVPGHQEVLVEAGRAAAALATIIVELTAK